VNELLIVDKSQCYFTDVADYGREGRNRWFESRFRYGDQYACLSRPHLLSETNSEVAPWIIDAERCSRTG
jgi:hypothetical protein